MKLIKLIFQFSIFDWEILETVKDIHSQEVDGQPKPEIPSTTFIGDMHVEKKSVRFHLLQAAV